MLEDRLKQFQAGPFPTKGPFSYSIEKDIDQYRAHQRQQQRQQLSSRAFEDRDVIVELPEDVLHPLLDSTNHRLVVYCNTWRSAQRKHPQKTPMHPPPAAVTAAQLSVPGQSSSLEVTDAVRSVVCGDIERGVYFKPTERTVMSHMWTHVYLGEAMPYTL